MPNHDDLVSAAAGRKATTGGVLIAARRGVNKALAASHAKPGNATLDTAVIAARSDVRKAMVASDAATAEWEAARDTAPSAGAVAVSKAVAAAPATADPAAVSKPAVVAAASPAPVVAKRRKSVSPAEAMRRFSKASAGIQGWKNNPAVQKLFASVVDYEKYLKGPGDAYTETKLREELKFAASLKQYEEAAKAGRTRSLSSDLTPEERAADKGRYPVTIEAREFWNSSPAVRREFHQNFEEYLSYRQVRAHNDERLQ